MANNYAVIREKLIEMVGRISQINPEDGSGRLREISEKLTQEQFNLVVMGQFKRGKSTVINAMLGAEIIPAAIVPLTSIVTILRFGQLTKAVVHYLGGQQQEIPLSEITKFVTEKGNPQNKLGVKEVEVFYPSDYLKDGVRIIDTPGVGSVFSHNTDTAYAYVPYVDAGIFIATADPPLGESEHQFLKEVRDHVDKLFFVLNKIDLVDDEKDLDEALAFTGEILKKDLGREVSIYPVSAKLALHGKLKGDSEGSERSRFLPFENDIKSFLYHGKGKTFLQAVTSALLRHMADETMAYKLEQEAAKLSLDELKTKIAKFEDHAKVTEKERDHKGFILEGQIKKLYEILDADLDALKKSKVPFLVRDVESIFTDKVARSPSSRELEKEMEDFVFGEILNIFSTFRNQESEKIAEVLERIYVDLANRTNETIESIVRLASDIFEVDIKPFTTVEKLTGKSDFYFLLRDDPDATALIRLGIRFALPVFATKGIILKRMREMAKDIFERHCGRVRSDLIRRTNETTRSFRKSLNQKIDLTLSVIRDALKRAVALKDQGEQEVSETLSNLSDRLLAIEEIRARLINYRQQVESL